MIKLVLKVLSPPSYLSSKLIKYSKVVGTNIDVRRNSIIIALKKQYIRLIVAPSVQSLKVIGQGSR